MSRILADHVALAQAASADLPPIDRSANADLVAWLTLLHRAMHDTGWTVDALAAHWRINRAHVWRLVAGEKSWSVERELSLPADVEARLAHLRAERAGLIVVRPLSGVEAVGALVGGLLGVLTERGLPLRAERMARIEAPAPQKKARTA